MRYADDIIIGFEHAMDARRFRDAMRERLAEYLLSLNPDRWGQNRCRDLLLGVRRSARLRPDSHLIAEIGTRRGAPRSEVVRPGVRAPILLSSMGSKRPIRFGEAAPKWNGVPESFIPASRSSRRTCVARPSTLLPFTMNATCAQWIK